MLEKYHTSDELQIAIDYWSNDTSPDSDLLLLRSLLSDPAMGQPFYDWLIGECRLINPNGSKETVGDSFARDFAGLRASKDYTLTWQHQYITRNVMSWLADHVN